MRAEGAWLALTLLAAPAAADVTVRVTPPVGATAAQVELVATKAPLNEVLDRLARQIGMKVVYEGSSPRQLVTLSLQGRSPAATVLAVLEGQGVNFALLSDPSGAGVQTLLVTGVTPSTGASTATSLGGQGGQPVGVMRRPSAPPASGPDAMGVEEEDAEEEEPLEQPAVNEPQATAPEVGGPAGAGGPQGQPATPGAVPVPTPRPPMAQPTSPYPVSPFAPQPFPPLPPGVPGAATPQPTQPQEPTSPPPQG
jgi:hypothetical protein